MSIESVRTLMQEAGWGYLATTDGEKAAVRPMGGFAWVQNELWCATFVSSDKVAQLNKKPGAEYCFADKDGRHVRIAGACTVSADQGDKDKLYELVPALRKHIADPKSPAYVVLRMNVESIRMMETTDMKCLERVAQLFESV